MKKLTFLTILVAIMLTGCTKKSETVCKINGIAGNYKTGELYVTIDGVKDTMKVNSDGSFSGNFAITKPVDATFQGDRLFLYLYLEPGKSLGINFDAKSFDSLLVFSGDLALPNKYLHEKTLAGTPFYRRLSQVYNTPYTPADFVWIRDSISKAELAFLDSFVKSYPSLDANFIAREKRVLEFSVYYDLYNYPRMVSYYRKDSLNIPDNWYNFLGKVNLDDSTLLGMSDVRAFISGYVQQEAMKAANIPQEKSWGNPSLLRAMFEFTAGHFKSREIYSTILFDKLKQHIDSEGTRGIEDLVAEYLAKSTNEKYIALIKDLSDRWAALAPGKPAPQFTLLDDSGKEVSLSDFLGKYVFIDFWATWCGPCRAEIPAYRKMVDDYKRNNIVFISMSVDKEKPKWEDMVKKEKFPWVQLHDPIKVNKKYLVMYIPTFTFIDPKGRIINARCPRPSDPELRKLFDSQPGI